LIWPQVVGFAGKPPHAVVPLKLVLALAMAASTNNPIRIFRMVPLPNGRSREQAA
jgi:hypothetical protein